MTELKINTKLRTVIASFALSAVIQAPLQAQEATTAVELAKKLTNPIASLVSVPFQYNYDQNIGSADEGTKSILNIQPVIPVAIGEDWNMISRTIVPVISQKNIQPAAGTQSGIGDVVQSLFFSPNAKSAHGRTWGIGPVFLLPTGSDDALTADAWGLGPTGILLRQVGPWTMGGLANHIWSIDEGADRSAVNATFLQPFISYTTPTAISYTVNSESTYDWEREQWSVPFNFIVTKMTRIGNQMVSLGAGARYYAESTDNGPEGWGVRVMVTLLYPK